MIKESFLPFLLEIMFRKYADFIRFEFTRNAITIPPQKMVILRRNFKKLKSVNIKRNLLRNLSARKKILTPFFRSFESFVQKLAPKLFIFLEI